MTFFSSLIVLLTNFYILYLVFHLNTSNVIKWKTDVKVFAVLTLTLIFNRGVFVYDYIFSDNPAYYNATTSAEQSYLVHLILFIIPTSLFTYLYVLIGTSFKRSLYRGFLFLAIPMLTLIFEFDEIELYGNLNIELGLLFLIFLIYAIELLIKVLSNKELSTLATGWVFTCLYAFSNILAKILYKATPVENEEIQKFSDGHHIFSANLIIFFIHLAIIFRFQRILTGDLRNEYKSILVMKNNEKNSMNKLEFYSEFKIWNNHGPIPDRLLKGISKKNAILLETSKSEILYKIRSLERDFICGEVSFDVFNNMYNLSEALNINFNALAIYFKPYCLYSYTDYIKLLRVLKADYLILSGFLKEHSAEQLSEACYFNNRITLYNNFKKFLNSSIRERSSEVV